MALAPVSVPAYADGVANTTFAREMVGGTGGGRPHENRQPFLGVNYCIALSGQFPG